MRDHYYDYDNGSSRGVLAGSRLRVLAAAALGLAVLCLAFLAGRASDGASPAAKDSPRSHAPSTPATSSATRVTDAPTTSPLSAPPAVQQGPPRRNGEGVIVGYRHDRAGAVAAAGNYTATLYVQRNRTRARELSVLRSISTSADTAARLAGDLSSEDAALAKLLDVANLQSPGVIAYGHPVGYRVEKADAGSATIDVYVVGGQGVAGTPSDSAGTGETFYEVDQVELSWQSGDWRLRNWSHLVQNNGPELATVAAQGYAPFPIGQSVPAAGAGS